MLDLIDCPTLAQAAAVVIGGGSFALLNWLAERSQRQEFAVATVQTEVFRWMVRRDVNDVLAIERTSFVEPWSEADLVAMLMQPDAMGLVLERQGRIVGYLIYQLQARSVRILRIVIHPLHRRMGVGRSLIEKLVNRPLPRNARRYWASVEETNLPTQLFLRSMGFRALRPARDAKSYRFVLEME